MKELVSITEEGELQSLDQVSMFRVQCLKEHDIEGARDAEAYCAAAAKLRTQQTGMEEWARRWQREAVEFVIAVGTLLEKQPVGRGNKIFDGANILTPPRRTEYRKIAEAPKEVREAYYAECEKKEQAPSKSGLRMAAIKAARAADIERQQQGIASGEITLPAGIFDVIDIDPPWPYEEQYDPEGRRGALPYPAMSLEEIAALPVLDHSAENCVLWLWTTHRFMRHSFPILDGWGFQEKAILTWRKDRMGLGMWLRSQSEFCIMATRGKPMITLTNQTTVLDGPMREHSRKPDEFYAMVEGLCPAVRRLIWFGREPRAGWHVGGNEPEKFDAA